MIVEYDEFRNTLTAFADRPADVDVTRGELTMEIRGDIIEAKLRQHDGDLFVDEHEEEHRAVDWIVKRVAQLHTLADRILDYVTDEKYFIEPAGKLLNRIEESPHGDEVELDGVTSPILDLLNQRPAGMSTGVYLTSDAGEGKTTLIHHLARTQAEKYKTKEADWLLLPIALGGRPFLRLDDVIIATLMNTMRFPFLYYDAFLWLVRRGFIVPALDGFEEMFVEGQAGDAVSSLGHLLHLLDSRGTILIAARSAFFEYKDLRAQAPLLDSFHDQSVDFVRVHLSKWDRERFVNYAAKRHLTDGSALFDEVASKLDDQVHPLLTRPVLIKRFIDVASDAAKRTELINNLSTDVERFFQSFVESIICREAHEKWIDRSGDPANPLLTVRQHCELLAEIAVEMWTSETSVLKSDMFDFIVELYAESHGIGVHIMNQIRQRIRQHALIVAVPRANAFRFEHDEFYHYFLGEAVGHMVGIGDVPELRRTLRLARLPDLASDVASRSVLSGELQTSSIETLNRACEYEPHASFVKDNSGSLAVRLIDAPHPADCVVVKRMSFPVNALRNRRMCNAAVHDSYFHHTMLSNIQECRFERCQFEQIDLSEAAGVDQSELLDCEVFSVVRSQEGHAIFAPRVIDKILREAGFEIPNSRAGDDGQEDEPELSLVLTERLCRVFFRSTGVNENTLKQRMGHDSGVFFNDVLPALLSRSVVKEVDYRGSGQQHRYRLGVSLRDVQQSIERAGGSFGKFMQGIQSQT